MKIFITLSISLITGLAFSQTLSNHSSVTQLFGLEAQNQTNPNLKSSNTLLESLDSSITEEYDTLNSVWNIAGKSEYAYDSQGNNTKYTDYWKATPQTAWSPIEKYEYVFNAQNQKISEIYYYWDDVSKIWIGDMKTDFTYNGKGQKSANLISNWLIDSNKWVVAAKSDFFYDTNGNDSLAIYSYKDYLNPVWIFNEKVESTFDNANLVLKIEYFKYDVLSSSWKNDFKYDYTYVNGILSEQLVSSWNNQWFNSNKNIYITNNNGLLIHRTTYNWNFTSLVWEIFSKDSLKLTSDGDILFREMVKWHDDIQEWVSEEKFENDVDSTVSRESLILPDGYIFKGKPKSSINYRNLVTGVSYQAYRSVHYYSTFPIANSTPIIFKTDLILFPNPASTSFSVSTEGNALLEITTLAGVKIMSKQIEGNETISIQNFPKAMYIVKVTNVKGEKSTTLIVK